MSDSAYDNSTVVGWNRDILYQPSAYFLHQSPFLFSTTPNYEPPSKSLLDVEIPPRIWDNLISPAAEARFRRRRAIIRTLPFCRSFHNCYFRIKQILDFVNSSVPRDGDNYYSFDDFVIKCGLVQDDSNWSFDMKLWYVANTTEENKPIRDILMAYLSLCWLHEDFPPFAHYQGLHEEHMYNNCVQAGDTIIYYIQQ